MKILTLLPVKNETWVLPVTLKQFEQFSDEVIILDDSSTDDLSKVTSAFSKVRVLPYKATETIVDMSKRRSLLLEEGRKVGGTHFIFLDADELFSETFASTLKTNIETLQPGDTLTLPWVTVYKSGKTLVYATKEKTNYKDFIFCDDGISYFEKKFLSEARTPGSFSKRKKILFENGCVYHLQHLAEERNQLKQAWYRCNELLEGSRSALRINATYDFTKRTTLKNGACVEDAFLLKNLPLIRPDGQVKIYVDRIIQLFQKKSIVFFEPLDIWHIPILHKQFVTELNREPRPTLAPRWALKINDLKNQLKNSLKLI